MRSFLRYEVATDGVHYLSDQTQCEPEVALPIDGLSKRPAGEAGKFWEVAAGVVAVQPAQRSEARLFVALNVLQLNPFCAAMALTADRARLWVSNPLWQQVCLCASCSVHMLGHMSAAVAVRQLRCS